MMKRVVVVGLFALFLSHLLFSVSYGGSASVLPKGVFSISMEGNFYFPIEERYDPDGDTEDIAADLNGTLDSSVFPELGVFEDPPFNLPIASLGDSVVSFEWDVRTVDFSLRYGITDRLSVGIKIPYWDVKNNVDARLDTTNATVGKNVALNTLLPLTVPGTVPLTTEDVQNLVGPGLDINGDGIIDVPGLGYNRVENWSMRGISDIEAGFRYQYLKTENWRLAFTGGVSFPTGEIDDPDNLADRGFGSGAWAVLFEFNHDYVGIENLVLNGTFKYDLVLPDKKRLRIPENPNQPVTANKENVDIDPGDVIELEVSGVYQILEGFVLSLLYRYGYSFKRNVSGDRGFAYESLEEETGATQHVGIIGLSYSTISLVKAKKFPLPLTASISYRNRFAGSNNVFKSQYIGFSLNGFF